MKFLLTFFMLATAMFVSSAKAQTFESMNYDSLSARLSRPSNKVRVVNFWATWCKPCVAELPYFEQLNAEWKDKNVEFILVSLDDADEYDKNIKPFLARKKLTSTVWALTNTDNAWIAKLEPDWKGAIPVTFVVNKAGQKIVFHSGDFPSVDELRAYLAPYVN